MIGIVKYIKDEASKQYIVFNVRVFHGCSVVSVSFRFILFFLVAHPSEEPKGETSCRGF